VAGERPSVAIVPPSLTTRRAGSSSPSKSPSRSEASETNSPALAPVKEEVPAAPEAKKRPTPEKLEKQYRNLIEEFMNVHDKQVPTAPSDPGRLRADAVVRLQEVVLTIRENDSPEYNGKLVHLIYQMSYDKKPSDRALSQSLIAYLFKEGVFTQKDIISGCVAPSPAPNPLAFR
jgi:hypothetical protein